MMAYPCSSSPASASKIWNAAEGNGSSFRFGMLARTLLRALGVVENRLYRRLIVVIPLAPLPFKANLGEGGRHKPANVASVLAQRNQYYNPAFLKEVKDGAPGRRQR